METKNYLLRKAKIDDATALAEIAKVGMPGYPFEIIYDPILVEKEIEEGLDYRVVAENPNIGVVGTAVLGLDGLMAELKRVVVLPSERGKGIAKSIAHHLVDYAQNINRIPWCDTRADQIGMQKSALSAGLIPLSLEQGKHVVYQHKYSGDDFGTGRETMVHMTSLLLDEEVLYEQLRHWSRPLRESLVENLSESLIIPAKNKDIAQMLLPSAIEVKNRIHNNFVAQEPENLVTEPSPDLSIIESPAGKILIIKPDASGFILTKPNVQLNKLLDISEKIGLQIVTYYGDIMDLETNSYLEKSGAQPSMIRTWQENINQKPSWQVGWRKTMNNYQNCLHFLQLDSFVEQYMQKFISNLQENVT